MTLLKLVIAQMNDADGNQSDGYFSLTADSKGRYMIADIVFMGSSPEEVGASVVKMLTPVPSEDTSAVG